MATPIDKMCKDFIENVAKNSKREKILIELVDAAVAWKKGRGHNPTGRLIEAIQAWEDIGG